MAVMGGTAADVLEVATSQLGTAENPPNSNRVPYWAGIGRADLDGESWCAAFVTWVMKGAGVPLPTVDTAGGYVYCPDELHFAAAHGFLVSAAAVGPGFIVLYQWGDEVADHTGIFEKWIVPGSTFSAIEGNTGIGGNDGVARKTRTVSEVIGFVRPPFLATATATPQPQIGATPIAVPGISLAAIGQLVAAAEKQVLREGSTGIAVGLLQGRLRDLGYNTPGMVDANMNTAQFGPKTLQEVRALQAARHLSVDGVVGPQTWSALFPR